MKGIKIVTPGRARIIHVETDLGVINIYVGLRSSVGRRVETVEMIPNQYQYMGEPKVRLRGRRFVEDGTRGGK